MKSIEGGANRVLYETTTRLASRGHHVFILTRRSPETLSYEEIMDGVKEYRYEVDPRNPLTFLFSTINHCRRLFEAIVEEGSFDIINFHQPLSALGVLLSPRHRQIQKVYTCHSLSFEEYETRFPHQNRLLFKFHSTGRRLLERYVLKRCQKVITLSEFMREKVHTRHGIPDDKIKVIPAGVDQERFHPLKDKQTVRRKLELPHDRFVLLTVRNLVPRMGLENLIHAMEMIVKKVEEVFLVVGGNGNLRESLETLVREKRLQRYVQFRGYIGEDRLPSYYQAADLFILPTICLEGFGLVTLEALASGTPVLGTTVGATPEILERLDKSLLFKSADPSSLAELIIEKYKDFKTNPEGYFELAHRCRSYAEEHYTWQRHVEGLEAIYHDLLLESSSE